MSNRLLRNVLVLAGAFWFAEWMAALIGVTSAVLGVSYGGIGRLGELWMYFAGALPRGVAAAGGTALLWLTLGARETRRWGWGLGGLMAGSVLLRRQVFPAAGVPLDMVSVRMNDAVYGVMPFLGCALAIVLLGRLMASPPVTGDAVPAADSTEIATPPPSRAVLVAWSSLMFLVGALVGTWIAASIRLRL